MIYESLPDVDWGDKTRKQSFKESLQPTYCTLTSKESAACGLQTKTVCKVIVIFRAETEICRGILPPTS